MLAGVLAWGLAWIGTTLLPTVADASCDLVQGHKLEGEHPGDVIPAPLWMHQFPHSEVAFMMGIGAFLQSLRRQ